MEKNKTCIGIVFDTFIVKFNGQDVKVCKMRDIEYGVSQNYNVFIPTIGENAGKPIYNDDETLIATINNIDSLYEVYNTFNINMIMTNLKKDYCDFYLYDEETRKNSIITNPELINICEKVFGGSNKTTSSISNVYKELSSSIINQDDQIKNIVTALYKNMRLSESDLPDYIISKQKQNILVTGPTGTGKTEIIRQLSHLLSIPMVVEDSSRYTEAGYVGADIDDMFRHLLRAAGNDLNKAERGILVLDEFDKLASTEKGNVSKDGVQESILTMLEGTKRPIDKSNSSNTPSFVFDTTRLTIIGMGAFSGIEKIKDKRLKVDKRAPIGFGTMITEPKHEEVSSKYEIEDFVEYGIMPEVMGRFPQIIQMNALKANDMVDILLKSKHSPLILQKKFFEALGINLVYDENFINAVAKRAYELNCGARSLNTIIDYSLNGALFEIFDGNFHELTITDECVRDNKKYILK